LIGLFKRLLYDEEGQGVVEYGLMVALISVIVVVVFIFLGPIIKQIFIKGIADVVEEQ